MAAVTWPMSSPWGAPAIADPGERNNNNNNLVNYRGAIRLDFQSDIHAKCVFFALLYNNQKHAHILRDISETYVFFALHGRSVPT